MQQFYQRVNNREMHRFSSDRQTQPFLPIIQRIAATTFVLSASCREVGGGIPHTPNSAGSQPKLVVPRGSACNYWGSLGLGSPSSWPASARAFSSPAPPCSSVVSGGSARGGVVRGKASSRAGRRDRDRRSRVLWAARGGQDLRGLRVRIPAALLVVSRVRAAKW